MLPLPTSEAVFWQNSPECASRDRQILLLVSDLIAFECTAWQRRSRLMPGMRPDDVRFAKRIKLALNAASYSAKRLGIRVDPHTPDPAAEGAKLVAAVNATLTEQERRWLTLSMQPVYTLHDEHMFLRILQLFETNLAWMAIRIRAAINAFTPFAVPKILAEISTATDYYGEARRHL